MYSEADLQSAVAAGALPAEAADALRGYVTAQRALPVADEEQFRLVTGFNDIFVSIACALVIFSAAAAGGSWFVWLGGGLVAAASWILAELFTRKRRMALPSIILLVAFVSGLGIMAADLSGHVLPEHAITESYTYDGQSHQWTRHERYPWQEALMVALGAVAATIGAFAHWRRFRVAITIAAGVGAVVLLLLAVVASAANTELGQGLTIPAAFLCGLLVFAFAMRWDLTDTARRTINADIAFWLHLLAAPLIAHPLFHWMGVMSGEGIGAGTAVGVLAIYVVFAVIALAVDRRALLVSALAYVLVALAQLFRSYGAVELNVALTALVIGSALLMLSAFWAKIRAAIVGRLPLAIRGRLPVAVSPSPA